MNCISVDSSQSSNVIRSRITVSKDLRKYFRHFDCWFHYDTEIIDNHSIRDIPVLSILLPFAWVTGSDVYVDELDRTFAESMDAVHREYKRMYPGLPFRTRLIADRLVDNKYESKETALLFSGGLDATYSLFSNIALKPKLIMIFGTSDLRISNVGFQKMLEREYSAFAEREGLSLNFVRTNALEMLNMKRVDHLFGSLSRFHGPPDGYYWTDHWPHYWDGIGFMLAHVGQAAPLSIGRFNRLLVANGASSGYGRYAHRKKYVDSEHAAGRIAWANLHVEHDGGIFRHEKTSFLTQLHDSHRMKLRVCLEYASRPRDALNCNHCLKCLMTIIALAMDGIDPNEYGFSVDQSTLYRLQPLLRYNCPSEESGQSALAFVCKALQRAIPDKIESDRYDAKRFFEWFKALDIDSIPAPKHSFLSNLYHRLPYPIANVLSAIWEKTPARRVRFYADLAFDSAAAL